MTGEGGAGQGLPESLQSLTPDERQILAVLAVVGEASLSADEVAVLAEVDDVKPVLDELRRLGVGPEHVGPRDGRLVAEG